jgi:uncharacterized damage-inducible protein DinB
MSLDAIFTEHAARKLDQLRGRILTCLDKLTEDQVWARGGENENAAGNLVLHLCGNLRQWIGTGVAGKPDVRERDKEFSARGGTPVAQLKGLLDERVNEAIETIRGLNEASLHGRVFVQDYDTTVMEAVSHVVEHFAQHTGQIILLTKHATGEDLGFYAHLNRPKHGQPTP